MTNQPAWFNIAVIMKASKRELLFRDVLKKFEYTMIEGDVHAVLMDGMVADLFNFIKTGLKEIDELEDPDEGDRGSHQDQAPEDFK